MRSFWDKLPTPFFVLAPMANVTDLVFRRLIAGIGKPHVLFTEFVSADGLISRGGKNLLPDLRYSEIERPIVAQLFSGSPEKMFKASKLVLELSFDGLDINMGCPDRSIEKSGAGAALIKEPRLAKEIIRAAREGVSSKLPISVKTRIGYRQEQIEKWGQVLLEENLAALTFHLRTRSEMSAVPAHWEVLEKIVDVRNKISPQTKIIGNGDVKDLKDAKKKARESGADGIMLGRAIFGNPWLFGQHEPSLKEKLEVLKKHAHLYEELLPEKSFSIMKKHFKAYVGGFVGAKELRERLMSCDNSEEVASVLDGFRPR